MAENDGEERRLIPGSRTAQEALGRALVLDVQTLIGIYTAEWSPSFSVFRNAWRNAGMVRLHYCVPELVSPGMFMHAAYSAAIALLQLEQPYGVRVGLLYVLYVLHGTQLSSNPKTRIRLSPLSWKIFNEVVAHAETVGDEDVVAVWNRLRRENAFVMSLDVALPFGISDLLKNDGASAAEPFLWQKGLPGDKLGECLGPAGTDTSAIEALMAQYGAAKDAVTAADPAKRFFPDRLVGELHALREQYSADKEEILRRAEADALEMRANAPVVEGEDDVGDDGEAVNDGFDDDNDDGDDDDEYEVD